MSIEKMRISEKNKLLQEIKILNTYINHDNSSVDKLRNMNSADKYVITQLSKLQESLKNNSEKLTNTESRLLLLEEGKLDKELIEETKKAGELAKQKGIETIRKKKEEKQIDEEDIKKSKNYYNLCRDSDKQSKEWYYRNSENHYFKTVEKLPGWISNELKNMPCNQGYIFKNVYFFGEKPKSSDTFKMIEAQKGYKNIHKWDKDYEYMYKQISKKPLELIWKKKRSVKF